MFDPAFIPAWLADPAAGLGGLFVASLLAATILPGGSEVALFAFLHLHPDEVPGALALATLGNTLGGMSTWACGRWLPRWRRLENLPQAGQVERFGPAILLLSWLPLVGDALCLAAGWLRLNGWICGLFMAVGKFARYALVAFGAGSM